MNSINNDEFNPESVAKHRASVKASSKRNLYRQNKSLGTENRRHTQRWKFLNVKGAPKYLFKMPSNTLRYWKLKGNEKFLFMMKQRDQHLR